MAEVTTAGSLRAETAFGRLVERAVILALAVAFLLAAYTTMGRRAEDTVARADLAAILPLAHAYGLEHGGYDGMTLEALRQAYGPSLETASPVSVEASSAGFCIETTHAGRTWRVTESESAPSLGDCGERARAVSA
jgi:hypothetical protein